MADEKPLTEQDLVKVLKDFPTRRDLEKILDDAMTLRGLATKDDLRQVEVRLETKIEKLERSLKRRMGKHRGEIMAAVGQLATTTPTRREFDELKEQVEGVHAVTQRV